MKSKAALILCLDVNKENKYEYECLYAIYSWRNCCHLLSNIDIIVYISKSMAISNAVLDKIKSYENVKLRYYSFESNYTCLNTLYCLYLFEETEAEYDYGIYIDLDMYLLRSIPNNFLYLPKNIFCFYGLHEMLMHSYSVDIDKYRQILCLNLNTYKFNTLFVINNRRNKIFSQLVKLIDSPAYNEYFNKHVLYNNDTYYYEEGLYDYAYLIGIINKYNSRFISDYYMSSTVYKSPIFMHKHIKSFDEYISLCKAK